MKNLSDIKNPLKKLRLKLIKKENFLVEQNKDLSPSSPTTKTINKQEIKKSNSDEGSIISISKYNDDKEFFSQVKCLKYDINEITKVTGHYIIDNQPFE